MSFFRVFFASFFVYLSLCGEPIETFYGTIDIEEPVLLELIKCPAMQRLKSIHQYGVAYYTTHREEYNRFDHSMGVMTILRKNGASLEEQISGLLHDVSHTAFSHVGDWIFGKENRDDDYQGIIFKIFLSYSGIEEILLRHGYTTNQVSPKRKEFVMLEQSLPDLCADRIDYNIQGAYFQGFLDKQEALELYNDLKFSNGQWSGNRVDLLKKLAEFSLFMTKDCWGSPANYVTSRWLAEAIIEGMDKGLISWHELHLGIDGTIWKKLLDSENPYIQVRMKKLANHGDFFRLVEPEEADIIVKFKCRGIDPWIKYETGVFRLSSVDAQFAEELEALRRKAQTGWPLKMMKISR